MWKVICVLSAVTIGIDSQFSGRLSTSSTTEKDVVYNNFTPCLSDQILVLFRSGFPAGEENQYELHINDLFSANTKMFIQFNTAASVTLETSTNKPTIKTDQNNAVEIDINEAAEVLILRVKGTPGGDVPYIESLVINSSEACDEPKKGFLDNYVDQARVAAELLGVLNFDKGCGRRKVQHTELIVQGSPTKAGDWPWHAAIYRFERNRIDYICGGTLLSAYFVLTAAHCVTNRGLVVLPETRNVVLGKYNLVGGDIASQEKEVHKIIIHEGFDAKTIDRDIALMKFKTAAEYTDFVQPACLWFDNASNKLLQKQIFGTVVGWGFDHTDALSLTLQQTVLPEMPDIKCIKSNPVFFSRKLNGDTFCAGYANGTSVCNGDSGGGFHVFIPDRAGNIAEDATGAWYVKGIVSIGVRRRDAAICDPESYSLFTDLSKYGGWINSHVDG